MPSLFVFFDFYIPLIYLSLFVFIIYFFRKFLSVDLKMKFLADYLPKLVQPLLINFKFTEISLYKFRGVFIGFFINLRGQTRKYLLSNYYSSLLLIILVLLFFLWDLIL